MTLFKNLSLLLLLNVSRILASDDSTLLDEIPGSQLTSKESSSLSSTQTVVPKYVPLGVFYSVLQELQRTGKKLPPNSYEDVLTGSAELSIENGYLCRRNPEYISPQKKYFWSDDDDDSQDDHSDTESEDSVSKSLSFGDEDSQDEGSDEASVDENIHPNTPSPKKRKPERSIEESVVKIEEPVLKRQTTIKNFFSVVPAYKKRDSQG